MALAAIISVTSGCVSAPDSPPKQGESEASAPPPGTTAPESQNTDIIASSTSTTTDLGADLQIDIYTLERLDNQLLRLNIGVTNNSAEDFYIGYGLSDTSSENSGSQITLIDGENQQRYLSQKQADGSCFCNSIEGDIAAGETENLWVIYPEPPRDLESMTVTTPLTPPILDVPISSSSEAVENSSLAAPEIVGLTNISDSLEGDNTGRTETSEEVSIILSSDVLFETNSSELTSEAESIIEQVAREIDDSNSPTVSIDGHADNTGDDSINIPLSQERAESVEASLSELITGSSVEFNVEGHGSADPIADNGTEEGRERNRRVSVTFEK